MTVTDYATLQVVEDFRYTLDPELNEKVNRQVKIHGDALAARDAKKRQSATYYAEERGTTAAKANQDILLGKKAEVLAMYTLHENFGFPLCPIDLEIREGNKKRWVPDLEYRNIDPSLPNAHVKCCSSYILRLCDDYSWTFQWGNKRLPGGRDELFRKGSGDLCAFMFMEHWTDPTGTLKAVLPWDFVVTKFRDPKLKKYIDIKFCLYYKDFLQ